VWSLAPTESVGQAIRTTSGSDQNSKGDIGPGTFIVLDCIILDWTAER